MTSPNVKGLTIDAAAAKLGKSAKTMRRWIAENKVKAWKVEDHGIERWYIDLDSGHPTGLDTSTHNVHDVQTEMAAEIRDLHEEIAMLREQLATKDKQISELHIIIARTQPKELEGPNHRRWWSALMFWKRG